MQAPDGPMHGTGEVAEGITGPLKHAAYGGVSSGLKASLLHVYMVAAASVGAFVLVRVWSSRASVILCERKSVCPGQASWRSRLMLVHLHMVSIR